MQRLFRLKVMLLGVAILLAVTVTSVSAEEATSTTAAGSESTAESTGADNDTTKDEPFDEYPERNWGTYYDPSNIFCGEYDCYKILGFDYYSSAGLPTKKEVTQSYRNLSKRWHPDKNKGDSGAEKRFMKINKAYKILTDRKLRKEYDHMRERPDEYFYKYGSTVYQYAPKSDVVFVILVLLAAGSAFTWFAQKNRWQQIANRVVKDAVDGLKVGEGGSTESIQLRRKAEEIMAKKKAEGYIPPGSFPMPTSKKAKMKMTKKEIRERENEELRPILMELVMDLKDFGAGFHQPTWRDLLVVRMVKWPLYIVSGTAWQIKYYSRRLIKAELNDEEKMVLTKRAVGPVAWETAKEEERTKWVKMELWIMENFEEWCEMQEVKQLSRKEQKFYNRQKKNEKKKANKSD